MDVGCINEFSNIVGQKTSHLTEGNSVLGPEIRDEITILFLVFFYEITESMNYPNNAKNYSLFPVAFNALS